jgi:hypothetical protein
MLKYRYTRKRGTLKILSEVMDVRFTLDVEIG